MGKKNICDEKFCSTDPGRANHLSMQFLIGPGIANFHSLVAAGAKTKQRHTAWQMLK